MQLNGIKQLETYARYHPEVVSLSQGISFLNSASSIRSQVILALEANNVDKYGDPQGLLLLREKIVEQIKYEGMQYSADEIIVTAGATEALASIFLTCVTAERDEVIIPTPTYSAWFRSVLIARGKPISLPLNEAEQWTLDINKLEKLITNRTAAILLCNPNNPTGSIYSQQILDKLCQLAQEYKIKIVIDEVYKQMIFDDISFYTPAVNPAFKKDIIRVVSFSKDFSLTGWRVGFIHSDRSIIQQILPVHDAIVNCAPVISQYAAVAALENQDEILANNRKIYTRNRSLMQSYLDQLTEYLIYQLPKGSYFFFPRFLNEQNSEKFCLDLLKKEKVAVVPGSDFGAGGENHIRLCFGRDETSIIKGMEGLTRYLTTIHYEK